ncbi:MAG: 4-hydroxythreonine-4-phosphate dehydrogenase PdxA [Terrimicrobiaceae bacterium]|nr:4-hydroxythreonine-4-phosphate dehydrogenase PdxA [Terrimicrobiaceae bacterium]
MTTPCIAITLGDPAGIGPEVARAALEEPEVRALAEFELLGSTEGCMPGRPTEAGARVAFAALEEAAARARNGEFAAVVTGPVSKRRMHAVGFDFPGQTEFFAARTRTENFAMCLTGGSLTVALVTSHVPLHAVPDLLTIPEIVRVGSLLAAFTRRRGVARARIAVAGLNPHAGEDGDLGREEIEIIAPAVKALNASTDGASFTGPWAPDTVFFRAAEGEFDSVLCMYHDQGLIPLKLHAFDSGVNLTLGLPFPRTSPDHGTAYEIAGRGIARPDSMIAAIRLAAVLAG